MNLTSPTWSVKIPLLLEGLCLSPQGKLGAQAKVVNDIQRLNVRVSGSPNVGNLDEPKPVKLSFTQMHPENVWKSRVKEEDVNLTVPEHEKKVRFDDQVTEVM